MAEGKRIDMSAFRRLYPFTSHYMDIGGLQYHYLDEGMGEPIVMIHGNPTWSFYYRRLVSALSPGYRTVVPDHIGCGLSEKPRGDRYGFHLQNRIQDLEVLLSRLEIKEKITLVLHDWGGMIGMAYGVNHPDRVSRLIVLNTAAFPPPGGRRLPLRLRLIRNLPLLAAPAVLGLNLFSRAALHMASHRGLTPDVKAGLEAPYNCWHNRLAILKFVQDIPLEAGDPSYRLVADVASRLDLLSHIPMMVCWGQHDFVFDDAYLTEWRRRFPSAEAHRLSEAGHYVLEDAPDAIIELTKDFLKRHPV